MSRFVKRGVYFVMRVLNACAPKFNWAVVISGCEDTSIVIGNGLLDSPVKRVFVLDSTSRPHRPKELSEKVHYVRRRTLKAFFLQLLSKYIFFTHGLGDFRASRRQVTVNLWHGAGYKRIGRLQGLQGVPSDYSVVSSPVYQDVHSRAFGVPLERNVITGMPRNDRLFLYAEQKKQILAQAGLASDYDKVLFWLPTFRQSGSHCDGVPTDNVFSVPNFDTGAFNRLLKENNALCLVKPHPLAPAFDHGSLSNVFFLDETWLQEHDLTLYSLLAVADCLISDVSSVVIDYIMLDRPIICMMADLEEYVQTRGVTLSPVRDWIPGPITEDADAFFVELQSLFGGTDVGQAKRRELMPKFHTHLDGHSTRRLLDLVVRH